MRTAGTRSKICTIPLSRSGMDTMRRHRCNSLRTPHHDMISFDIQRDHLLHKIAPHLMITLYLIQTLLILCYIISLYLRTAYLMSFHFLSLYLMWCHHSILSHSINITTLCVSSVAPCRPRPFQTSIHRWAKSDIQRVRSLNPHQSSKEHFRVLPPHWCVSRGQGRGGEGVTTSLRRAGRRTCGEVLRARRTHRRAKGLPSRERIFISNPHC